MTVMLFYGLIFELIERVKFQKLFYLMILMGLIAKCYLMFIIIR